MNRRARERHVSVDEVHAGAGGEVLIPDVAAADDRDALIDDPGFVVHPMIEARAARKQLTGRAQQSAPRSKGIEQADLDARVTIERDEGIVVRPRVHVVEQHAHAHAAICGAQQLAREEEPRRIAAPDVVLHVYAAFGALRARDAQGERVEPVGQQSRAGFALRDALLRKQPVEHRRPRRIGKRL